LAPGTARVSRWPALARPQRAGVRRPLLYDLILEKKFTRALEIGTSTGHSGIWIAWALSKTAGTLVTIEIDPRRHREAVANFTAARPGRSRGRAAR
jgi:predicted O-methyltransferase YrrM